jgi:polyisoprenyl-phosphate glycosyltransferase
VIVEDAAQAKEISVANTIDIIVPFYNEAGSIQEFCSLLDDLVAALDSRALKAQAILVDDGSTDGGLKLITQHCNVPAITIELSRNFGKEVAVLAGIDASDADYTLIMDSDLQHSCDMALSLIDTLTADEALDVVFAKRSDRKQSGRFAQYGADAFYRLINWGQRYSFPENAGDFRVMRKPVTDALKTLRDQRRFNKGLYAFAGFRQKALEYIPAERHSGEGKWSKFQMIGYSLSAFTSFSVVPLRLLSLTGLLCAFVAIAYGVKIVFEVLVSGVSVPGFPSLLVAVVFLGGLNLALLGLIGEYVWVGVLEGKNRPVYLARRVNRLNVVNQETESPIPST